MIYNYVRASLKRKVKVDDARKEPPLTKMKFANQRKDKNKGKVFMASIALPPKPLVIGLEAT